MQYFEILVPIAILSMVFGFGSETSTCWGLGVSGEKNAVYVSRGRSFFDEGHLRSTFVKLWAAEAGSSN